MRWNTIQREKHTNEDGWLTELISMDHEDVPFEDVHSYLVFIKPGATRAMHYHKKKKEWITVGSGKVKIFLEDLESDEKESIVFSEDDKKQELLYLPPKVAHVVKNIGDKEGCVIAFSQTLEMPEDTIKYDMDV